jgi:DeoR family transcriptional regulator, glycerol-3-phosphate regulon repressor
MNLSDRQSDILTQIRTDGRVEIEALASIFSVTTQTIRRDVNDLCELGLAVRMHGGARMAHSISNVNYKERRALARTEKENIGALVASLIPNNCSVMLNIGTTTEQVARALNGHTDLVVISNNINVISTLIGSRSKELILAGGTVRQSDGAIVGEEAVDFISKYKVDYAIIGASGMDIDGAVLDFDSREVSVSRAILRNSRTKILACDHLKFERTASIRICDIGDVDYFVTDQCPPTEFGKLAASFGTQILCVDEKADDRE